MATSPELGYRPELDGLRTLAVVLVLVFHADVGVFRAGYVGVSVFFTLSGYLITRLLLDETRRTGRVDLVAFWTRRARRLLPASAVCLLGVVVLTRGGWLPTTDELGRDVLAAMLQVFNWSELAGSSSYADLFSARPGPLDHFWSLSIEEQFYWLWPAVIAAAARVGRVRPIVLGATAMAWLAAPVTAAWFGGDAAYWATPARAGEILTGAALAVLVTAEPRRAARPVDDVVAALGIAAVLIAAVTWPTADGPAYGGWFPVFSLATAASIWGTRHGGRVQWALARRPLVAIGTISYGLYLYHWPVYLVVDADRVGVDGWRLLAVRGAITVVLAAISYRMLEQPIRRGAVTMPHLAGALAVLTAVVVAGAATLGTTPGRFELAVAPQRASAAGTPGLDASVPAATIPAPTPPSTIAPPTVPAPIATAAPATSTPEAPAGDPVPSIELTADQRAERRLLAAALAGPLPLETSVEPLRVLVVGDSTAWALADGMFAWSDRHPDTIDVTLLAAPGCSWGTGELVDALAEDFKTKCDAYLDDTLEPTIAERSPQVVVVMTTFADLDEWIWSDAEGMLIPPSDAFAAHLAADYRAFADRLRSAGATRIVWVKGPRVMHSAHSDRGGPGAPGRMEMQHAVIDELAADDADLSVLDLNTWYLASEYGPDDGGRSDRLHFDVPAATDIADRLVVPWLVEIARLGTTGG